MSLVRPITIPSDTHRNEGNKQLFVGVPLSVLSYCWMPVYQVELIDWLPCAVSGFFGLKAIIHGLIAFRQDYNLRKMWEATKAPSQTAHDSGFATSEEIKAAGCYDCKGRILGTDIRGRPIGEPYKLKPTNSMITGAAGAGKTTCFSVGSCILSLFSSKH